MCLAALASSRWSQSSDTYTLGAHRIEAAMRHNEKVITENIAGFESGDFNSSRKYSIILSLHIFQSI